MKQSLAADISNLEKKFLKRNTKVGRTLVDLRKSALNITKILKSDEMRRYLLMRKKVGIKAGFWLNEQFVRGELSACRVYTDLLRIGFVEGKLIFQTRVHNDFKEFSLFEFIDKLIDLQSNNKREFDQVDITGLTEYLCPFLDIKYAKKFIIERASQESKELVPN